MRIVIDIKNLALYGGGIAHWFAPLLAAWIEHRPDVHFDLLGPNFSQDFLPHSGNWAHVNIAWPQWLPRPLRHPWYDNVLFPRAVKRMKPDLVLSPYHDVRMPKGVPSVIGVHDLCLDEMAGVYPARVRTYYLAMLRSNLRRASHVITVSQTSRQKLAERYGTALDRVSVVYNATSHHFAAPVKDADTADFKLRHDVKGRMVFYPGGSEYRKNVHRLVQAFQMLLEKNLDLTLLVTGIADPRWHEAMATASDATKARIKFAGKLSEADLRRAYAAADTVVYPSLCEGFGRVCLEAMEAGAPLACSDLPVMREVAGDYACWFYPYDSKAIADALQKALTMDRKTCVRDPRFESQQVNAAFLDALDAVLAGLSTQIDMKSKVETIGAVTQGLGDSKS